MQKTLRGATLVAALMAAVTGRANAVPQSWSWQGCGGAGNPGFNTCASVSITYSGGILTMVVENWGTTDPNTNTGPASNSGSSVFSSIGIANFGTGSLQALSNSGVCFGDTCSFLFQPSLNSLNGYSGAEATPPPTTNGLNPPASPGPGVKTKVVLTFTTSGSIDLANASFALHGINGPSDGLGGNCSTKLIVGRSGSTYTPNSTSSTTCAVDNVVITTTQVVPEPGSMLLLASGLVGMAGAGFIRRRKV